jgi:hypothetical protein
MTVLYDPRSICKTLECVASSYGKRTKEYKAVELEAQSLLFIHASHSQGAFKQYLSNASKPLSADHRRYIRSLGL